MDLSALYERRVVDEVYRSMGLPHWGRIRALAAMRRRWRATIAAAARHHPAELARFRQGCRQALRQTTTVDGVVTEVSHDGGITFDEP